MFGKPSKTNKMELQWAASLYETAKNANVPFFFKQVSHNKPDQGINALELYLSDQSENLADPESADCFRRYPKVVGLPMIPPTIEGSRLSQAELEKYMKPSIVRNVKQKNEPAVHEPESASTAQQQAE
jgi:hypothetical protein